MKASDSVRKLTTMGILAGISIILVSFIRFPLIPAAPFLEYDPADIPIFICTFLFGPLSGLALTIVVSIMQGITVSASSGIIGIMMHIFATGSFSLIAGNMYARKKNKKTAVAALFVGTLTVVITMCIWNIIFTPLFMGIPQEAVMKMLIPAIIPFNLFKAGLNGIITFAVYKKTSMVVFKETCIPEIK